MTIAKTFTAALLILWAGLSMVGAAEVSVREDVDGAVVIDVVLPRAVPYRVFTLDAPRRLILDFKGDMDIDVAGNRTAAISAIRSGRFRAGWTRIVADLDQPLAVESAELKPGRNNASQAFEITLKYVNAREFIRRSIAPPAEVSAIRETETPAANTARRSGDGIVLVALDPGHGGVDPGAHRDDVVEKTVALEFALELRRQLQATERYEIVMTRTEDEFMSLRERVARIRDARASVMISLHANTVTRGRASGAAVYVLGQAGADSEADATAILENSADMLSGLVPDGTETDIVRILTDMARIETNARSAQLAQNLIDGLSKTIGVSGSRPSRAAEFKVLRAPDVPSVLLELGFLSDAGDRADLGSPQWRTMAAQGIVQALDAWVAADAAAARLARQ